jgi:hypothetical protein
VADVVEGTGWNLHADGIARPAAGIAVEIALAPVFEMGTREDGRLVGRNVLDEA